MKAANPLSGLLAVCASIVAAVAHAQAGVQLAADVADPNLPCAQVAEQTRVHFTLPLSQAPSRYTLRVNGEEADASSLEIQWPTLTLHGGLHPGRNRLTLDATGSSGQVLHRSVNVQVGSASGLADTISVTCDLPRLAAVHHHPRRVAQATAASEPAPAAQPAPTAPQVVYEAAPPAYAAPYYPYYGYPAYTYAYPYPYVYARPYWGGGWGWGPHIGARLGRRW